MTIDGTVYIDSVIDQKMENYYIDSMIIIKALLLKPQKEQLKI